MSLPKMIVFDLDACLWMPEMFELTAPPTKYDPSQNGVRAGQETVKLFQGAQEVLRTLLTEDRFQGVKIAVASSTTEPKYANRCLEELRIDPTGERVERVADLVDFRQIYPGSKGRQHFPALREESGIPWTQMLFFDDQMGNIRSVSGIGVLSIQTRGDEGVSWSTFLEGLRQFNSR